MGEFVGDPSTGKSQPLTPPLKNRGPKTPEGKARSAMNALKHGLRAEKFRLLPEESVEEFVAFAAEIRKDLKPRDAMERQFVEAIVIAFWREVRADRMEADVMSDMPPKSPDRVHGSNLVNKPENRASLATMLRYRGQVSMDLKLALANFADHRKARGSVPADDYTNDFQPAAEPANQNCTNDFSPLPEPASEPANENCTNELVAESPPANAIYTNDLSTFEEGAFTPPPTPEPTSRGEGERGAPPLSQTLSTTECTNDLLLPTPQPSPQRPVVHRREKVPLHHRRWW